MGNHTSSLRDTISAAFDAAAADSNNKQTIGLEKLISLPLPSTSFSVDRSHLGVLFVLDSDHDGRFSKQDLFKFVDVAAAIANQHPPYEFRTHLQGHCTGKMWSHIAGTGGRQRFVEWLTALVREACDAEPPRTFRRQGKEVFVGLASVQALHTVFDVQDNLGLTFHEFFDLLQRAAEERGLMDVNDAEQDDWVPLSTVASFAESMHQGIVSFVGDILPVGSNS